MQPLYSVDSLHAAYHLRYTWSGWPSSGIFPDQPRASFWDTLTAAWEEDGLRLLEQKWTPSLIQFTCSVKPSVAPIFFTGRVKGRLQHALRKAGCPVALSRKVGFRTIGDNHREDVENYIERQVTKERFVDARFEDIMRQFSVADHAVDLSAPTATGSERYWYNLHLVLVVEGRYRIADTEILGTIRDWSFKIAAKKSYLISRLSVMPDHLHAALRGNIEHSPEGIALTFLNNLAFAVGQKAIWEPGYYVGTFSEYDMDAVRS